MPFQHVLTLMLLYYAIKMRSGVLPDLCVGKRMCCLKPSAVFHIRIGGHLPVWVSDAKINLPGWKLTCLDEQIVFINITDENNNMYYLIYCLFTWYKCSTSFKSNMKIICIKSFWKKQSFFFLNFLLSFHFGTYQTG